MPKRVAKPKEPKGVAATYQGEIPVFYANFANVSSTNREIFIDFCLVAPPYDMDAKDQLRVPVIVRVVAVQEFAQALNEAITTRLQIMKSQQSHAPKGK